MRRLAFLSAAVIAASITAVAVATSPADAATTCGTVTTTLTGHEDGGNNGVWATETLTRTTKICPTAAGFHADVTDDGTFTTIVGSSPQAGTPLPAGVQGKTHGSFVADFTADGLNPGSLVIPSTTPSSRSSEWIPALVAASGGSNFGGNAINGDWTWTYATCSERWTDAGNNQDGELPADGDITGKPCPAASPTKGPGVAPAPTHPAAAPVRGGNAGSVPNPGLAPVAAVPGASASSVSPTASDSYNPLGVAPATTAPGFSVGPVVPAGDTAEAQSGGSHLAGYLIGTAVALLGIVLALWLAIARHRRSTDEAPVGASTTRYAPGVAGPGQGDTAVFRAVDDEQGGKHGAVDQP